MKYTKVIATKFTPRTQEEMDAGISGQQHIENYLNQSLKNLGMDYVDLYIYHMWDYHTPMEEIMEGLHQMVKAGKARYIGISNCFAWQLAKANFYAREHGLTEFISVQGHYNLIAREEEREMVSLEQLYVPHGLVGVMAQNGKQKAGWQQFSNES